MTHQSHSVDASIVKVDDEKKLVFGWASIIKDESGKILLDRQDDFIDSEEELEKAAYDYVLRSRDGGEMHVRRGVAKMVESVVFTEEKQRALGIPVGSMPTGWWIGFKVNDSRVWEQVKKGEYSGFSVHGTGKRESTELPVSKITEIGKGDKVGHPFRGNQHTSGNSRRVSGKKQIPSKERMAELKAARQERVAAMGVSGKKTTKRRSFKSGDEFDRGSKIARESLTRFGFSESEAKDIMNGGGGRETKKLARNVLRRQGFTDGQIREMIDDGVVHKAEKKSKNKIATVMREFKAGKLKSSSGEKVTDPKQAMAIAISEQKRAKMKKVHLGEIMAKKAELNKRFK